ncbi:MAG: methyltransferase domain-containing protein [Gaiellaceae bacterium]
MAGMPYDNRAAAQLEQAYATTDMVVQREELRRSLRASAGESILDLGSGPGFLACELAQEVGATGRIVGVDISSDMNLIASTRIAAAGLGDRVDILEGDANALAFADATFDAAVSMQVIEYLADPDAALKQLVRVLRPGGRIVIIDTDWDSLVWAAMDRHRAARIAAAWNEHLPDPYLPRSLAPRLRGAGFEVREIRIVPILNTVYDATSFSYNIASLIAAFVPGRGGVSEDEATKWLNDLTELQHEGRYFFSINRYLFAASRPNAGGSRLATGL